MYFLTCLCPIPLPLDNARPLICLGTSISNTNANLSHSTVVQFSIRGVIPNKVLLLGVVFFSHDCHLN